MSAQLKAPFPYNGGKGRWAEAIWARFGNDCAAYLEPFCGSMAVLLANPNPCKREVVCDLSPHIANFWRAVKYAPDEVAFHADYPTIHHELHARNLWLAKWGIEHDQRVFDEADYYDAKAAGWWAWGKSHWIGGEFPSFILNDAGETVGAHRGCEDLVPLARDTGGGKGVTMQRDLKANDQIPYASGKDCGGKGVTMQRTDLKVADGIPYVCSTDPSGKGVTMQKRGLKAADGIPFTPREVRGRGVTMQRVDLKVGGVLDGSRLQPWMRELAERLQNVIVLRRSWESCLTKPLTMKRGNVAVMLDPPYLTSERSSGMYASDREGTSDDAARDSYAWAVERGSDPRFRIAYCCHEGDFPVPDGWDAETATFKGIRTDRKHERRDMVMFSPHCLKPRQADLFA